MHEGFRHPHFPPWIKGCLWVIVALKALSRRSQARWARTRGGLWPVMGLSVAPLLLTALLGLLR